MQLALDALEVAEWGAGPAAGQRMCPVCIRGGERDGHEPGCGMAFAIAALEEQLVEKQPAKEADA